MDPAPDQAVVDVKAISLNRGETNRLARLEPGTVTGWDLAGVVSVAALDGSGPPVGARVVGLINGGAWVSRACVRTSWLAELPEGVSFAQASCLPVAGLTALRAFEHGGYVAGKDVLVTGAAGGVGRLAIQLGAIGGARVTGVTRDKARAAGLESLGATSIVHALQGEEPKFDLILDGVGGATFGDCVRRLAPGGLLVSYASSDGGSVEFGSREFFVGATRASIYGLYLFEELVHSRSCSTDLRRLADLIAAGRLDPQIDLEVSWREAGRAVEALLAREVAGKAVLHVD